MHMSRWPSPQFEEASALASPDADRPHSAHNAAPITCDHQMPLATSTASCDHVAPFNLAAIDLLLFHSQGRPERRSPPRPDLPNE